MLDLGSLRGSIWARQRAKGPGRLRGMQSRKLVRRLQRVSLEEQGGGRTAAQDQLWEGLEDKEEAFCMACRGAQTGSLQKAKDKREDLIELGRYSIRCPIVL